MGVVATGTKFWKETNFFDVWINKPESYRRPRRVGCKASATRSISCGAGWHFEPKDPAPRFKFSPCVANSGVWCEKNKEYFLDFKAEEVKIPTSGNYVAPYHAPFEIGYVEPRPHGVKYFELDDKKPWEYTEGLPLITSKGPFYDKIHGKK